MKVGYAILLLYLLSFIGFRLASGSILKYYFLHIKPLMHGLASLYISNLVTIKSECSFDYNLRSSNQHLLQVPQINSHKTLGDRSFSIAAPNLWNALPWHIRNAESIDSFKKQLKTYFFKLAYF